MNQHVENANKYLVHNVRHSLTNIKLLIRHLSECCMAIEKTVNIYREMIDELFEEECDDDADSGANQA